MDCVDDLFNLLKRGDMYQWGKVQTSKLQIFQNFLLGPPQTTQMKEN